MLHLDMTSYLSLCHHGVYNMCIHMVDCCGAGHALDVVGLVVVRSLPQCVSIVAADCKCKTAFKQRIASQNVGCKARNAILHASNALHDRMWVAKQEMQDMFCVSRGHAAIAL